VALKALLAADDRQLARNLLHQLTAYATGAPVRFADRPEIEALLDATAGAGYRVGDLLRAFVTSRIFRGLPPPAAASITFPASGYCHLPLDEAVANLEKPRLS
jgi:hypothetical protein